MASSNIHDSERGANIEERLTVQQQMFVHNLLADESFSSVEAARKAGYKTPNNSGYKLLQNPAVAAYIGKQVRLRKESLGFDANRVIEHLVSALFLDPIKVFDQTENGRFRVKNLSEIPEEIRQCITKMRCRTTTRYTKEGDRIEEDHIEVEFMSKDAMMPLAMKHFGFVDAKGEPTPGEIAADFLSHLLQKVEQINNVVTVPSLPAPALE